MREYYFYLYEVMFTKIKQDFLISYMSNVNMVDVSNYIND